MRVFELHAPLRVVQRSHGRSAVAAAAYRAGERLEDERTGLQHDYTRKRGIEETALLLPVNAPDYAHDRAELWNACEARETHPRAQTARDLTVSFPAEFSKEQRKEAGLRIGEWLVCRYGVAVDMAWHEPSRQGDDRNHHLHLLMATRRWDENGEWAKAKDRMLDDRRQGPEEVKAIRLGVSDVLNNIAARDQLPVYTEHVSFERRGLDREATQHVGPIATQMEREGVATDIGDKNRAIQERNRQREALREEQKVIDIGIAREKLQARQQEGQQAKPEPVEPSPAPDPYAAFYREAQERRAALLEDLNQRHGERERLLRRDIAGLTNTLENAGFFARVWRGVTGRTQADQQRLAEAQRTMEAIQRERQAAHEAFERERQQRLEALKESERLRELRREAVLQEADLKPAAKAIGDVSRASERQAATTPAMTPEAAPAPFPAPQSRYEDRRREYFRRVAAQKKAEREREEVPSSRPRRQTPGQDFGSATARGPADEDASRQEKPSAPTPSREATEQADAARSQERAQAEERSTPQSRYEARRAAYMSRSRATREPERESGPSFEPE